MRVRLVIPVYEGGYNMAAEGFQHEMLELQIKIQERLLGEDRVAEIVNACNDDPDPARWSSRVKEALLADAVEAELAAGNTSADDLIARFEEVYDKIDEEWGIVE